MTSWTPVIIRPEISALMEKLGYHTAHTGGDCWTWEKVGPTSYAWISTDNNRLSADPAAPVWVIGRYRNDDGLDQTGWINVTQLTLDQAVEHIERLPTPERGQEVIIDGLDALLRALPNQLRDSPMQPLLAHEFPEFDATTLPAIPEGFEPAHWRNEACPHWTRKGLDLFVDYADPTMRENPGALRYTLLLQNGKTDEPLLIEHTEDWAQILYAIEHIEARALAAHWVKKFRLGYHPDTRGRDYTFANGARCLSDAEAAAYDREVERLFELPGDPYEHGLAAMRAAGLLADAHGRG